MGHFTLITFLLMIQLAVHLELLALMSFLMDEEYGIFVLGIARINLFDILNPFVISDLLSLKS